MKSNITKMHGQQHIKIEFWFLIARERNDFEKLGGGKIILKWIFKKGAWSRSI